jgi:hypothetical protein
MLHQVDDALPHAMSGTELSRVRTELRLLPPEAYQQKSDRVERGRHCYAIKWFGRPEARPPVATTRRRSQLTNERISLGADLKIDFVFVIVAEVNDVVAAVAGAPFTAQALGMDRKQNRCPANRHIRIINRRFDHVHRKI